MLSVHGRKPAAVVVEPIAKWLTRMGLTPNSVTLIGTVISVALALWLIPTGHHFAAAVLIGITVATDMVDGTMARLRGGGTNFGATLDATCDRIADGAIFGALCLWFAGINDANVVPDYPLMAVCLVIVVASQVTSYVKARAEASSIKIVGGLVERPERLIISLVCLGLDGLGVPHVLAWGLWVLAAGSVYTVVERLVIASRDPKAGEHIAAPAGARTFDHAEDR
ncbi:CDP-alcohol phosphatidyltransferase family protein [Corynebacterium sp. 320]|uniref:Phosphatidylinositol phosphate synthase n=1 Tax=Corynebacterium zhongnanshanii TaxID=2768834 RepID=A0ABQ6VGU1_9CORY|nr:MULTISPECIES: CDP-alcohol phosphatidyltransferase family protein [Corynebacterium]KAB1503731.1 CDP-alcohol phosphatidyltransferase family protein [Corynebacterium sp. 320]KAB1553169.1 CDP-alcohol phosphatidyltransferase family protein [Corynebacterium sp. 321]KAB1553613.1 CDP-alcohol phosphatidyltransferase family protein [Corynebacterium sp. 319]KAB3523419.1 CDP-alcohol phosphatidyltransferase family protein [Corynebacterium zhongnanshanii]KAB3527867.1 CDP-alcohol phosphatidyltransferase f